MGDPLHEIIFEKKYNHDELIDYYQDWYTYGKSLYTDDLSLIDDLEIVKEPALTKIAKYILEDRYLWHRPDGTIETPFEMFDRVARATSMAINDPNERALWYIRYLKILTNLLFLPNSPTLMNAGRTREAQLSACFVIPVEDSIEGIYKALADQALTQKMGGGTGFSFSRLRTKGQMVSTTHGVASGVLSFMKLFDLSTEVVQQGGMRRGANMAVLNYNHPEIRGFITAKDPENTLFTNFNLSVAVTDAFMNAVENAPDTIVDLIDPHTKTTIDQITVGELFDLITSQAHKTGDPGLVFIDTINKFNTFSDYKLIEATNPCGEEPLLPYGACNLGSINLDLINDNKDLLIQTTIVATRFLDNVVDVNEFPLKENYNVAKNTRDIGLGVMGFAHMLFKQNIPYNSDKAIQVATNTMRLIQSVAIATSNKLAERFGPFPWYDLSVWKKAGIPVRNANMTSIAPTGSISLIAGTSSGIEPVFLLSYKRRILFGSENETTYNEINKVLLEKYSIPGHILDQIIADGSIQDIDYFGNDTKRVFVTSHDIDPSAHIAIQAAFQRHVCAGVSKTINLKHHETIDTVKQAYLEAWKLGCKGITIYRDGSKTEQVISKSDTSQQINDNVVVYGITGRLKTNYGKIYVTVNYKNYKPFETFINIGKSGNDTHAVAEAIGRLISLCLQNDIKVDSIIKQLKGIGGENLSFDKDVVILSLPDAIAKLLERITQNYQNNDETVKNNIGETDEKCPICGAPLIRTDGCMSCLECGYSKCA